MKSAEYGLSDYKPTTLQPFIFDEMPEKPQ